MLGGSSRPSSLPHKGRSSNSPPMPVGAQCRLAKQDRGWRYKTTCNASPSENPSKEDRRTWPLDCAAARLKHHQPRPAQISAESSLEKDGRTVEMGLDSQIRLTKVDEGGDVKNG